MYTLKVENENHNVLELSGNFSQFQIIKVGGLSPPAAVLNRSSVSGMDGSRFQSGLLGERNIVIECKILGDVEKNRLLLYQFFATKHWCKLYYKNNSRDVYIEGYVETVECDLFAQSETMQISILCPEPYLKSLEEFYDDISKMLAQFEFPFAIDSKGIEFSSIDGARVSNIINKGERATGVIIDITINGAASSPTIQNIETGEKFGLNIELELGDHIVIDTNAGSKSVILIRDGVEYNIFSRIIKNSVWFTLKIGENFFAYEAKKGAENMHIVFRHYYHYEGV